MRASWRPVYAFDTDSQLGYIPAIPLDMTLHTWAEGGAGLSKPAPFAKITDSIRLRNFDVGGWVTPGSYHFLYYIYIPHMGYIGIPLYMYS